MNNFTDRHADAQSTASYQFVPAQEADAPLLREWFAHSHVQEWWGDPDDELELFREGLTLDWLDPYLVSRLGRPFAYIQCYDIHGEDYQPFPDQPAGTRGIDQFIGEPDMIGRGHGSRFIRQFTDQALADGVPRIVTDPDPRNARAIAAYRRAGFEALDERHTPWGRVLLMTRDHDRRTGA